MHRGRLSRLQQKWENRGPLPWHLACHDYPACSKWARQYSRIVAVLAHKHVHHHSQDRQSAVLQTMEIDARY